MGDPDDTRSFFERQYAAMAADSQAVDEIANSQLWKSFGCDTEAGRALRSLYTQGGQSTRAQAVRAPAVRVSEKSRFSAHKVEEGRRAAQQVVARQCPSQRWREVEAPRVGVPKKKPAEMVMRGKKPHAAIREEMEFLDRAVQKPIPPVRRGADREGMKEHLQNKFAYGSAFLSKEELQRRRQQREAEVREFHEAHGMESRDVELEKEIRASLLEKKKRLEDIDARMAAGKGDRIALGKQALELEAAMQRDAGDLKAFRRLV